MSEQIEWVVSVAPPRSRNDRPRRVTVTAYSPDQALRKAAEIGWDSSRWVDASRTLKFEDERER